MKPILKTPLPPPPRRTPAAYLLAVFAAGFAAGAAALVLVQGSPSAFASRREPAAPAPETRNAEGLTLSEELAKIESDAQRELAAPKATEAPGAAPPIPAVFPVPPSAPPVVRRQVEPAYPPLARAGRFQGPVDVRVFVDERGRPTRVEPLGGNLILQAAALDAARQWRFQPALKAGQPVPSEFRIRFAFKLV